MNSTNYAYRFLSLVLCVSVSSVVTAQTARLQGPAPERLRITILEGEGALNNIKQRTAREPIVQVEDENRKPVAGAMVMFLLPDSGPSGTFVNGSRTLSIATDKAGRAKAVGLRPNDQPGPYQIKVIATIEGVRAEAMISQTNVGGSGSAVAKASHGFSPKWLIIIGVAASGAAIGAAAATRGGGSRSVSVAPGPGTVGPPTP